MAKTVSPADVLAFFASMGENASDEIKNAMTVLAESTYNVAAEEIISRKVSDDAEDFDVPDFVARMFSLAEEISESFTTELSGGQNGSSRRPRTLFGFDTPNGHLQVRLTH